jgi:CheY-like chemotaxis protein
MTPAQFILVVEDDPILKNLLGHTFAGKYQTLYASSGTEALELIEQYHPSLMLLDIMLPGMDGYGVLEEVRKRTDALKDIPIVMVSNLSQQSDIDKAKALGATDYLVKAEVPIEDIVTKIESLLPVQTAEAEPTPPTA